MFAVPGWNVSPASLVQQKQKQNHKPDHTQSTRSEPSVNKKRKRSVPHDEQASKISGTDLERLWSQRKDAKLSQKPDTAKPQSRSQSRPKDTTPKPDANKAVKEDVRDTAPPTVGKKDKGAKKNKGSASKHQGLLSHKDSQIQNGPASVEQRGRDGVGKISEQDNDFSRNSSAKNLVASPATPQPTAKLTPLQLKMRSKLTSARFRHLNETLYTTSSTDAMSLFTNSPDLFAEYHAGFSQQVNDSWPQNPVDNYVLTIKTRGPLNSSQGNLLPLPRRKTQSCTIADLGCGDAPLARGCQSLVKKLHLQFHNYDLHAPNIFVTKADISSLPLREGEADIAIFCLSLMGTNWLSFVEEAWRILRGDGKGEVWVAEVKSRFGRVTRGPGRVVENSVGKRRKQQKPRKNADEDGEGIGDDVFVEGADGNADDETDISAFVKVFSRRGFVLREDSVDKSNKMFVSMVFVKSGVPTAGKHKGLKWNGHEYQRLQDGKMKFVAGRDDDEDISPEEEAKALKPCVYKTR
ncbi:25S rRNA (adenine645-N1)-methyltransferase [Rhinocladiella similis]